MTGVLKKRGNLDIAAHTYTNTNTHTHTHTHSLTHTQGVHHMKINAEIEVAIYLLRNSKDDQQTKRS